MGAAVYPKCRPNSNPSGCGLFRPSPSNCGALYIGQRGHGAANKTLEYEKAIKDQVSVGQLVVNIGTAISVSSVKCSNFASAWAVIQATPVVVKETPDGYKSAKWATKSSTKDYPSIYSTLLQSCNLT
ncbi:hypothetical protein H257_07086 [Aphanomyces astaci]|uniref:Uncharacterized protein n=1 Tax=Aphanomyces astaci TaxID=112090 RepID=W4GKI9_APHAT|nr:hypothetical protein H257_07086 [Aphanomyces astaci]ETV79871.1 hypothetical protein H257_07086 [Aphanomyces astaci]|eukprot:XP_009830807.1 hypothetical protein H257_07086 [Aphanomyces astaci]